VSEPRAAPAHSDRWNGVIARAPDPVTAPQIDFAFVVAVQLIGRRLRSGDVLAISFRTNRGLPERAKFVVRNGRLPKVKAG
jgi:hypothetical protein